MPLPGDSIQAVAPSLSLGSLSPRSSPGPTKLLPHPTLSPAHPCGSLVLQPASQHRSVPHRDSSESIENLLVSFAPADSQFAALHGRQLGDPKVEPCARWMSQGFYQRSLCVAMQSHNSSGSQGPAVIVLAWAGVTWRWGRAERLARAKLWPLPVCLWVCWWGDGLRGGSCLELCWL